nr:MAG TPA: tail repeat-like protein [Caudoviricetes sp.]
MPTITGDLRLITNQPAAVTALQIHAPEARTSAGTVILPAPAVVPVVNGKFTVDIELGAAVCIPEYSGTLGEPIHIAIRPGTATFAEALDNGRDLTPEERDRVVELYQKMITAGDAAKAAVAKAEQSATQAAQAAVAAKESADHAASGVPPATATVQGKIRLAGDLVGTADSPRIITAGAGRYSVAAGHAGFVQTQPNGALTIEDDTIRDDAAAVHKGYVDARISRHTHTTDQVKGLDTALAGKAPALHTHPTSQVTGLDNALAGKAAASHTHTQADITDLPQMTDTTSGNTLVVRDPWGHITAADPNYKDQVATKGYIDAELEKLNQIKTEIVLQNSSSAKKIGRIVCLYVNINSAGSQGTLPYAFRPSNACYIAVYTPTKLAYPGWMTVSPNGDVYVQFSQSDSAIGYATAVYTSAI